jgi:hypothetical protein
MNPISEQERDLERKRIEAWLDEGLREFAARFPLTEEGFEFFQSQHKDQAAELQRTGFGFTFPEEEPSSEIASLLQERPEAVGEPQEPEPTSVTIPAMSDPVAAAADSVERRRQRSEPRANNSELAETNTTNEVNTMNEPRLEIVRADEIEEKVLSEILKLRDPDIEYKDQPLCGYWYMPYQREAGCTQNARQMGILTVPGYNREISNERVKKYTEEMCNCRWRTCFSDPITITAEGDVINGQHRLAAASQLNWNSGDDPDAVPPAFLVIWNVSPDEARFADGSHRTHADEKAVLGRLVDGKRDRAEKAPASPDNSPAKTASEQTTDQLPVLELESTEAEPLEELMHILRAARERHE